MLRIGNRTSLYRMPDGIHTDFQKMREHGYNCADFSGITVPTAFPYVNCTEDECRKFLETERENAKAAGITISQVHGPWPVIDLTEEQREQNLEWMKMTVRWTAILKAPYLVIHPVMPFSWGPESDPNFTYQCNYKLFKELCQYAKDFGVGICIENMPSVDHTLARIPQIVAFVDQLGEDNFSICLDTGHCNCVGDNVGDMIRFCGKHLSVLHVHDNLGDHDSHYFPYFGTADWGNFKKALADIGFSGVVSIESNLPRIPKNEKLHETLLRTLETLAENLAEE